MKKSYFLWLLWVSMLLAWCTPIETPTPQPEISWNVVEEVKTGEVIEVSDSVFPEKESKYTWSRHMEKPELTEMDNFVEMIKWVLKKRQVDYEITENDVNRISDYCEKDEVEIYDEYNEFGDLEPIQTIKKSEVRKWNKINVRWTYKAGPLAELSENQQKVLSENGWVITPATTLKNYYPNDYDVDSAGYPSDWMSEEWINVYDKIAWDSRENHRYSFNTLLITNDLLLHVYHKLFENSLKYYEETEARETISLAAYNLAAKFNWLALEENDPELKEIYQFLAAYREIPVILTPMLDDMKVQQWEYGIPQDMSDEELDEFIMERANIYADNFEKRFPKSKYASAIIDTVKDILDASNSQWVDHLILAFSPDYIEENQIWQNYTLFQPRSHYTDSNALKTYFMAAKWLMREKFYYWDENLVKAALVMASQLDKWDLKEMWTLDQLNWLSDMIENLVWTDDDLTLNWLMDWAKKNKLTDVEKIMTNLTKQNIDDLSNLVHQRIASSQYLVNYTWEVNENEWKSMTDWFVFFGEKFTLDAYLFDLNTASKLQAEYDIKPNIQTAIMVPDILQWDSVANELTKLRLQKKYQEWLVTEKQLKSYSEVRSDSIEKVLEALKDSKVVNNIYHKRLNALGRLVSKVDENAPYFMQSRAYAIKNIVTYLWSYTELKHDTLLYVKQPMMAELWWGGMWDCEIVVEAPALPVPRWYIEADINLIDELLKLSNETKKYYKDTSYESIYDEFEKELEKMKTIVLKQMSNQEISDEDFEWMRNLDGSLYTITAPIKADYSNPTNKENRWSLIADIFTSDSNNVLYEATGRPALMYLMVKDVNWARVVVWPVFTHYEFYTAEAPINTTSSTRFTDEDWQANYDEIVKDDLSYWDSQESDAQSLAFQQMLQSLLLHTYATGDYIETVLIDE